MLTSLKGPVRCSLRFLMNSITRTVVKDRPPATKQRTATTPATNCAIYKTVSQAQALPPNVTYIQERTIEAPASHNQKNGGSSRRRGKYAIYEEPTELPLKVARKPSDENLERTTYRVTITETTRLQPLRTPEIGTAHLMAPKNCPSGNRSHIRPLNDEKQPILNRSGGVPASSRTISEVETVPKHDSRRTRRRQ